MPPAKAPTQPFVGIDLGGTNVQLGVVSPDLRLIGSAKRKTKAEEGLEGVLGRIISGVEECAKAAGVAMSDLGGVGIGAPGAVDAVRGIVIEAVNLRWDDVPLAEILTKRLKMPVYLDNDVNVAVYGENKLGSGKNAKHCLGIWAGTGIGGGLILNGQMYYGGYLTAGEIGHTILFPNMPRGERSLEQNCSRTTIVDRLVRLIKANQKSKLVEEVGGDLSNIKSKALGRCYEAGDKLVCEVIDSAADLLGIAAANAVTLLSLERVIIGGGLTEAVGKPFVDRIARSFREHVFPEELRKVEIVASHLEDNAGVFGAALIAMERSMEIKPAEKQEKK